jgi:hypothetical protein
MTGGRPGAIIALPIIQKGNSLKTRRTILRTEMAKPGAPEDLTEGIGKTFRPASK